MKGRGTEANPPNRFVPIALEKYDDVSFPDEEEDPGPKTLVYRDASRSVLTTNDSPDVGFSYSVNPYRGCEHGCAYCYARPTHEWLGLSAGLDFETKLFAKLEAPALLREALAAKSWNGETVAISGVTDAYQPVERRLRITRGCLEVLSECRNPIVIITKSHLVTRDIDLLAMLAAVNGAFVILSVTSLDDDLAAALEPRAARPRKRLDAIRQLHEAGIPVGVNVAPVVPGLTDHEIPSILKAAKEAGAQWAGYTMLRLPYGVSELFGAWLQTHRPDAREKVLNRVREVRGGKLNDSEFGSRMRGEGVYAEQIRSLFRLSSSKLGYPKEHPALSSSDFRNPVLPGNQLTLF